MFKICICKMLNIWHSKRWKKWGGKIRLVLSPPFHLLFSDEMLVEEKGLALCQAGDRCCPEWAPGRKTISHPFAPGNISDLHIPWSTSRASPRLALCRTLPPTPVCSANQPTIYWWNGNQRKQLNTKQFLKAKNSSHGVEHFLSVFFSSVKAVTFYSNRSSI